MEEIAPTFPNPPSPEPPVGPSMPVPTQPPVQQTAPPPQPPQSSKFKPILLAFALVIVITASGVAGYSAYQKYSTQKPIPWPSSSSSPTPIPTTDPTANWKTYTSHAIGYTLKAPPDWYARQTEDDSLLSNQDYLINLNLSPEPTGEIQASFIAIVFPISIKGPHKDMGKLFERGLIGLAETDTTEPPSHFSKQQSSYTTIAEKHTLVTVKIWNINPPTGFAGSWCRGCTQKNYYIDLENDKILEISGHWTEEQQGFEKTFDQILSTFKFTN